MAFNNRVLTTTQDKIMPSVVDAILKSNVFLTRMLSKTKKWSGETMKFPLKYQKGVGGSSFAGFDLLSTSASDTRVNLAFDFKSYSTPIALPLTELTVNGVSETKVIDLMAVECKSKAEDMADDIGTLFYADGTGNAGKDFLGLSAIVDDGTNAATYGGLTRAAYPVLNSTVTASGGTLTLAKMETMYNAITDGSQQPTLITTTPTIFGFYATLLTPQEQIYKTEPMMKGGATGGTGFTALYFKGMPMIADRKCTSQTMYFINEDYINFYAAPLEGTMPIKYKAVDIRGNDYSDVMGLGFTWSDFIKPTNQAALIGHVYLAGELISENPGRHGKLTGITTV